MGKIDTIIFDIDGTLIDTKELYGASYSFAFEKLTGKKYSLEEIIKLNHSTEKKALNQILDEQQMRACTYVFYQFYEQNYDNLVKFYPGVKEILLDLNDFGFKMGIFTGKSYFTANLSLKKAKLDGWFNVLVTEKDYLNSKPNPEGLVLALKKLDSNPENSIYIGDAFLDFLVARNCGAFFGVALWGSEEKEKIIEAQPDFLFKNPEEILSQLRSYNERSFDL